MAVDRHKERDPVTGKFEPILDEQGNKVLRPCAKWAMVGFDVCQFHAPGAQQRDFQKAKEQKQLWPYRGQIRDMMTELDVPDMHPMDGLLECVRWAGAMCRSMAILAGELPVEPVMTHDPDSGRPLVLEPGLWGLDHLGEQAPHVLVNLYALWHDRYVKACKLALDAGIDERLVRNAEATSATLLTAFQRALDSVPGVTEEVRTALGRALAREVRAGVALPPATQQDLDLDAHGL